MPRFLLAQVLEPTLALRTGGPKGWAAGAACPVQSRKGVLSVGNLKTRIKVTKCRFAS